MNTAGAATSSMGAYMFTYIQTYICIMLYYTHTHNVCKSNEYQKHLCQNYKTNTFITYCALLHCRKHLPFTYIFENEQADITAVSFVDDITWRQLSKPCWTYATIGRTGVMLKNTSELLQMSSQKWNTLEDSYKCIHACTIVLLQEWDHIPYVWTYYISIIHCLCCLPFSATIFFLNWLLEMAFTDVTSDQHVCFWYVVNS